MSALRDYIARLRTITVFSQEEQIFKILKENEATIIDLNLSQLSNGQDSDGKPIEPPYTELTREIKREKGQPVDRVTLRDEGDFYRGFFMSDDFPMVFDSKDWKTDKLTDKYGSEIFGLNKENQGRLNREVVLLAYLNYLREVLLIR
jgi:hypothetical protein